MFEIEEDILDLDQMLGPVEIDDGNAYISDSDKALTLFASFFRSSKDVDIASPRAIRKKINSLFKLIKEESINNELEYYNSFINLFGRLSEREKLRKIGNKTVISLGGEFSAGKSNFINSIANINGLLPEAQSPTTSIPTYIIHGESKKIIANSIYGYSIELSENEMQALTHEFYTYYGIGFSTFIESIVIETPDFSLGKSISMLDTPGYNKYDGDGNGMRTVTDRIKAFEQLKITDYLIWLIDIEKGGFTDEALKFIDNLELKKPILVVLNKADKRNEKEIIEILDEAKNMAKKTLNTKVYGITAYSSRERKEYFGANMIEKYLNIAENDTIRSNDVQREFKALESGLRSEIFAEQEKNSVRSKEIFNYIKDSQDVMQISSLAKLWSETNQASFRYRQLLEEYDKCCENLNRAIIRYMEKGGQT